MTERLIHPDEAIRTVASFLREPELETVSLAQALGRALARPVVGGLDQPPFDKAAMDGWAWKPALEGEKERGLPAAPLRVRAVIAAGNGAETPLLPGEAAKIMTGAPLPPGADRVQRVEWSEESQGLVSFTKAEGMDNVIRRGENARAGAPLLEPRLLAAQDIAILAADGRAGVEVARRPVVGILSTGSELAEPGSPLKAGQIYDSNRPQLLAQLSGGLCEVKDLGSLRDDYDATLATVRQALDSCDILILSGGVSMGDFDFVPRALSASGVETIFHGVAMKPGKPTFFGKAARAFVVGLPGNPVSVFVNTELLVKPLAHALSGLPFRAMPLRVPMARAVRRKGVDRVEFLPVRIVREGAEPVSYGGSSAIQALALADGFVRLEIGQSELEEGIIADVRLVR